MVPPPDRPKPRIPLPRKTGGAHRPPIDDEEEFEESLESATEIVPVIESYKPGELRSGGIAYHADLIVLPHGIRGAWKRENPKAIRPEDIRPILSEHPEVVLFGVGATADGVTVEEETLQMLERDRAECVILTTQEAIARYNEIAPRRRTCAAIIV